MVPINLWNCEVPFCNIKTTLFQLHIERLPDVQKPASCPRCDSSVTFSTRFELNSHFLSAHAQSDTKFPCGQCLEMVTKGLINQHIQRKHVSQNCFIHFNFNNVRWFARLSNSGEKESIHNVTKMLFSAQRLFVDHTDYCLFDKFRRY